MNNDNVKAFATIDIGTDDGSNLLHHVYSPEELEKTVDLLKKDTGSLKTTTGFFVKVSHVSHFVTYIEEK